MPRKSGNKLKLLYLRDILNERTDENNCLTAPELIKALSACGIEAERKSIYDDIEALRLYGMDIESTTTGYYVANRDFELPELKMLIDVVQSAKFLTEKKSIALIKKIEGFAPKSMAGKLRRSVVIGGRIKAPNERIYYSVDAIHTAIADKKKITFKYFTYGADFEKVYKNGGEKYVVTPMALMWDDEYYYLVAYDEKAGKQKNFRVDKMENTAVSKENGVINEATVNFDKAEYAKMYFNMFGGEKKRVTLWIDECAVGMFADRFGTDGFLIREENGGYHAEVEVAVSPHFYSWIFGLEGKIRIVSPESVKDGFTAHCRGMIENGIK